MWPYKLAGILEQNELLQIPIEVGCLKDLHSKVSSIYVTTPGGCSVIIKTRLLKRWPGKSSKDIRREDY